MSKHRGENAGSDESSSQQKSPFFKRLVNGVRSERGRDTEETRGSYRGVRVRASLKAGALPPNKYPLTR